MKLLISGSHNPHSLISIFGKYFESFGFDIVRHYGAAEVSQTGNRPLDRIVNRIYPAYSWRRSSEQLLNLAKSCKPDCLFLFKGMDIYAHTLTQIRELGIPLIAYNADHPFAFSERGTGNANVTQSIPIYDLFITYSRHIEAQMRDRYPTLNCTTVPFGHEVSTELYNDIFDETEILRVGFVGTADKSRAKTIGLLSAAGLPIDVIGPGWERWKHLLNGANLVNAVYGVDYYRQLRAYRVQLNIFRPHNYNSHNMRSFEVPACGGILLAPDTTEHRTFFNEPTEAAYFKDTTELIQRAKGLLALTASEAAKIRENARRRSIECGYSYADRAQQLATLIKQDRHLK